MNLIISGVKYIHKRIRIHISVVSRFHPGMKKFTPLTTLFPDLVSKSEDESRSEPPPKRNVTFAKPSGEEMTNASATNDEANNTNDEKDGMSIKFPSQLNITKVALINMVKMIVVIALAYLLVTNSRFVEMITAKTERIMTSQTLVMFAMCVALGLLIYYDIF